MTDSQPFTPVVVNHDGRSSFADGEVSLSTQYLAEGTRPMLTGPIPGAAGVVYLRTGPFEGTPHPAPRGQWLLEDTTDTGHVQRTVGDPPFEALFTPAT
jgi:hypothetical protein